MCWTSRRRSISRHSFEDGRCFQDCPEFQCQNAQVYGYVVHDIDGPNHGQALKIQRFFLNEICTETHLLVSCDNNSSRKFCWNLDGKKYRNGIVYLFTENKDYSCQYTWMTFKWLEESRIWLKKVVELEGLGEPTSYLDHENLGCTQRELKPNENIIDQYGEMFERRVRGGVGSQVLFNACKHVLEGGVIPVLFAESRTVFIPKSSDVDNNGRIVRSPEALRPLTLCNCDCKILTTAICRGLHWYTMRCIHPSQRCISSRLMTDNIFEIETTALVHVACAPRRILPLHIPVSITLGSFM